MADTTPTTPTQQDLIAKYSKYLTAGAIAAPQDLGDYVFGSLAANNLDAPFQWDLTKLPASVDLRTLRDPIENQFQYGACVGHGVSTMVELFAAKFGKFRQLSRDMVYYNARIKGLLAGQTISDNGASVFLAMGTLTTQGICDESLCGYPNNGDINAAPSPDAVAQAATQLVGRYERVGRNTYNIITGQSIYRDLNADVRCALALGMPVVFALGLTSDFYGVTGPLSTHPDQYKAGQNGFVYAQTPGYIGGHCMCIVGYYYDAERGDWIYICQNSWDTSWGDGGYFGYTGRSLANTSWDVFTIKSFQTDSVTIPLDWYKWTADADLTDGTSFTVDAGGQAGQIYRLYKTAFNRKPDLAGMGYHFKNMLAGQSLTDVAAGFLASPEAQVLYGGGKSDIDFVTALYRDALGREPDAGGLAYHVANIQSGMPRSTVLIGFSESAELKATILPEIQNGIQYIKYAS